MTTTEVIQKLRGIDLSLYPFNEVHSLVQEFQSIKVIRITIETGAIISRVRKGNGYKSRKELSYPPIESCQSCQRANLPNSTMFYGTISDSESPTVDNRAIAMSECSSLAREGKESKGIVIVDKLAELQSWNYFDSPAKPAIETVLEAIGADSLSKLTVED